MAPWSVNFPLWLGTLESLYHLCLISLTKFIILHPENGSSIMSTVAGISGGVEMVFSSYAGMRITKLNT